MPYRPRSMKTILVKKTATRKNPIPVSVVSTKSKYKKSKKYSRNFFAKRWAGNFTILQTQGAGQNTSLSTSTFLMAIPAAAGIYMYAAAWAFKLNDLPGYSEYQSLYDQYKITGVQFKLIPLFNSVSTAGNAVAAVLHSVVDIDDITAPLASTTGIDDLRQYQKSYRTSNMISGRSITRFIRPNIMLPGYDYGTTLSKAMSKKSDWIDSANPDIAHYGFKFIVEAYNYTAVASTLAYKVELKYYLTLKNPN